MTSLISMPVVGKVTSKLFALPEYEIAQFDLLGKAISALMKTKDTIYAQIQEAEPSEILPTTQNTMPSGGMVQSQPVLIENKIEFQFDEIRSCDLDALAGQVDAIAEERIAIVMPHFFSILAKTSEAAGTATDMKGAPLSFDSYLLAFSKIELRFDKDGQPILPQLVVHPNTAQVLAKLPPWTEEQQRRWDEMIEEKRKEFFANRRHRKLS